jgi:hypothetical protein
MSIKLTVNCEAKDRFTKTGHNDYGPSGVRPQRLGNSSLTESNIATVEVKRYFGVHEVLPYCFIMALIHTVPLFLGGCGGSIKIEALPTDPGHDAAVHRLFAHPNGNPTKPRV